MTCRSHWDISTRKSFDWNYATVNVTVKLFRDMYRLSSSFAAKPKRLYLQIVIIRWLLTDFSPKKKNEKKRRCDPGPKNSARKTFCVFLNRTQSINTCEMFIVFCCLPQCHSKNWKPRVLAATSQKSLKERTQQCMSANVELLRYSETNNSRHWSDQDWVNIYCYTQSLISTTRVVYAWQSPQKREGFSLLNLEG